MIILKTPEEIKIMREAGKRLAKVVKTLKSEVKEGVTTLELDKLARELIEAEGGKPSFLGYKPHGADVPFPYTLCSSVNDVVVHGLPSEYKIQNGDLVKIDLGLILEGFHSDTAITIGVGEITKEEKKLIRVTEEALWKGIELCRPGKTLGDLGAYMGAHIEKNGFGIVRDLVGHGIGKSLHEDPHVFNFGTPGYGEELREGMVLALEPMVTMGGWKIRQRPDDSFVTADGSKAAHFEHTVAITNKGPQVLTVL